MAESVVSESVVSGQLSAIRNQQSVGKEETQISIFDLERMNELELYVEEGPNSGWRTILATDATHPYMAGWWPPGHIIGYEHTFIHTVLDLLKAIDEQRLPTPNFHDGVGNQKVLDAIERASSTRSWVTVSK